MKKLALLATLVATVVLAAPAQADDPVAVTDPANGIESTSVGLNGHVTNADGSTKYYFEYGLTTLYGAQVAAGRQGTTSAVRAKLTGLLPVTIYHYRLVASKNGNLFY